MDVRCPQCDTLYEVDAAQMRGDSATLKCSQCSHLFRMQSDEAVVQENHRRWMVRSTSNGDVRYFSSFAQLHEWILAGKVDKSDQISRTGKSWTQLTDIGEFMPILQAVDSITSISATHAAATPDGRANSAQSGPGPSKSSPAQSGPAQSSPAQSSPAQSSPAQSSPAQSSPAQSSPAQSSPAQSSPNKPAEAETVPSKPDQPDPAPAQPEPSRRPADTSKQFGVSDTGPRRTTGSHTAGSSTAGSSTPGSHTAATRPNTGSQPNTGPPTSADQSGLPPSPSDESPPPRQPPKVRLQTGAFGAAGPADARAGRQDAGRHNAGAQDAGGPANDGPPVDDQWSFGDAALGEVEDSGRYRGEPAAPGSASRWPVVAVVCVVVLAAAAATIYRVRPDLLDGVVGDRAGTSVVELSRDAPAASSTSPGTPIWAALVAAKRAARRANDAAFVELADTASSRVWAGVEQAQTSAKKAAQTPDVATLVAQGNHLIEDGRPRRARSKFRAVLDADSDNVAAMTGLGWSLLAMGRSSAASARFRRALRRTSSSGDAYIGLAKAQRNLGNNRAALDAYQAYLADFPDGAKSSIARYQTKELEQAVGP